MIWKDVPGYEGLYQVSDCGQVKSLKRLDKLGRFVKEKILKPGLTKDGYECVNLYKEGVIKSFLVHRLVMYAHSHVDKELTVNHIDENKRSNHISNLEYCTQGENIRKYQKNNPDFAKEWSKVWSKVGGKIGGKVGGKVGGKKGGGSESAKKAVKEKKGHKYLDAQTDIVYLSAREVSFMMYETGQANGKWVWFNILQSGKPQDRFVRV